jgi:catechol 2,3-dioxygenase-like lactoylglutathione lyase family enzyme
MIDHIGIKVQDYTASLAFYVRALAPLGYAVIFQQEGLFAGLGADGKPDFWISAGRPATELHIAIAAPDRAAVHAFHAAALAAGGKDNGAPGPRPQYHPGYYAAFVIDPNGYNLEAVCHAPAA